MKQAEVSMISILCSGSRGDIQPYIALAQEIIKAGRNVRIVAGNSFKALIEGYGIGFYSLSADYKSVKVDPKLLESAANSTNPLKMLFTFSKMKKYARLMVDEMAEACYGSELLIYHPGCAIAYFVAEQMGIPAVMASPFPMLKTKEVESVIAYGKTRMPVRLSYMLLQKMLWMASKPGIVFYWKEKFGKLPPSFGCPFEKTDLHHPSVVSCSNYVFPRPRDWNEHIHQYGYWFISENEEYIPPKELAVFLQRGEKPIYFGFGSMFSGNSKEAFVNIIAETLKATGKRGILCGMGEINNLPEYLLAIDAVPHTWLFPRCAAVCHHGGAGTSAAGFAAGVPSMIIPFSNDQFAWAHRAYDIGVGAKPIYKSQLSARRLTAAVQEAVSEQTIANARKLGEHIAAEKGAVACARVIVDILR